MASRRTRIKGIANIPQRRKTINASADSDDSFKPEEVEQKEETTSNLTSSFAHANVGEDFAKPPLNASEKHELSPEVIPENVSHEEDVSPPKEVSEDAAKAENVKEVKPTLPVRRKFIKPTVSLNAINRKSKDTEEAKVVPVSPKQPKNSKIVILNEIIAYPNQDRPFVIRNGAQEANNPVPEVEYKILSPPPSGLGKPQVNPLERDIRRLGPNNVPVQNSDPEYPIPPPSPSKVNRSRIKAVPRLGQRNTSFSASESEDESRRNYRHRNDSVCSTASGFQDCSSISECPSPQKPREFNSVIQRKCRRTEQSRKLAEARRDFFIKFGNKKPDRQKLTMIDLIFYNPTTNPMTHDSKKKDVEEGSKEEEAKGQESVDDPSKSGSDEENEMPAPQIKIGPEGEIVVDEQSLVIENKAVKRSREEIEKSKIVNGDFDTGYGVYKRAKRSKDWSKHETLKFYKALNTIGTDFTLMCELFPRRSRRELKMKFKKEERINKALIDRAIMQPCGFDFNDFKHEVDMEEKELQELEKQKEREQQMRKDAKKRKTSLTLKNSKEKVAKVEKPKEKKRNKAFDIYNVLDDSDADESEIESVFDEDEESAQDQLLQTIQKPTRSGRVPKMLDRYRPPESESSKAMKADPGSLIVVASTGSNGEPVYRLCMVTGEQGYQQVGNDMSSLSKALECKQNSAIQSLLTITTSNLNGEEPMEGEENNITIPEENNITTSEENTIVEQNITIPADDGGSMRNDIVTKEELDC